MEIRDFQGLMKRIYFHRDSERGVDGTYDWLVDEVEELGQALKKGDARAMMDEFADVLAWLASLANIISIDLDLAATSKYNGKCPKCQKSPCQCAFVKTQ